MGMAMTVFKSNNEEYNESSKVPLLLDIKWEIDISQWKNHVDEQTVFY